MLMATMPPDLHSVKHHPGQPGMQPNAGADALDTGIAGELMLLCS